MQRTAGVDNVDPAKRLLACCRLLGVTIGISHVTHLGQRHKSVLMPSRSGGFRIVVSSTTHGRSTGADAVRRNPAVRLAVAHELAHTLFYDRTVAPPARNLTATQAEEEFCDAFARSFLGIGQSPLWDAPESLEPRTGDADSRAGTKSD